MKTTFKTQFLILVIFSAIVLGLSSCNRTYDDIGPLSQSQNVIDQDIPLANFNQIEIGNSYKVFVKQGKDFSIVAHGDRFDIADLEAKTSSNKLKIKYKFFKRQRFEMEIYITMPSLKGVDFSGATYAEIEYFDENDIYVYLSGASKLYMNCNAKAWDTDLSGASTLEIEGRGKKIYSSLSGASQLNATRLLLNTADLDLSGSSRAWVDANEEVVGSASGASVINYRGNPRLSVKTSGSSALIKN